jgi:hypothetical protein
MREMRKFSRHFSEEVIKYRPEGIQVEGDYLLGITHEISKSGARLFLMDKVDVGEKISILCNPVSSVEGAVVKWVKKVQDEIYMAGLMFE